MKPYAKKYRELRIDERQCWISMFLQKCKYMRGEGCLVRFAGLVITGIGLV